MKLEEREFLPVILGGDITTYSLARSFHEEYHIKSIAISMQKNWLNSYSSIIEILLYRTCTGKKCSSVHF